MRFKRNADKSYVASAEGVDIKVWRHCRTKKWVARLSFTTDGSKTLKAAMGVADFIATMVVRKYGTLLESER